MIFSLARRSQSFIIQCYYSMVELHVYTQAKDSWIRCAPWIGNSSVFLSSLCSHQCLPWTNPPQAFTMIHLFHRYFGSRFTTNVYAAINAYLEPTLKPSPWFTSFTITLGQDLSPMFMQPSMFTLNTPSSSLHFTMIHIFHHNFGSRFTTIVYAAINAYLEHTLLKPSLHHDSHLSPLLWVKIYHHCLCSHQCLPWTHPPQTFSMIHLFYCYFGSRFTIMTKMLHQDLLELSKEWNR